MTSSLARDEIETEIADALADYGAEVRAVWERIRIAPERWSSREGEFWVVAIDGDQALWFDDIHEAFNWSSYSTRGTLDVAGCEQLSFAQHLEQIAHKHSETARARLVESGVPAELRGPGSITLRQSTYWDVTATSGAAYRIHFRDKAELVFADSMYETIEIHDQHPLLMQYDEPHRSLYFVGTTQRPHELSIAVDRSIRDASGSWRGLRDYKSNVEAAERSLRSGHGLFVAAPATICSVVAAVLEAEGVQCSILGDAPARPGKRALLLGRSYVIASGFAFEKRIPCNER